MTWQVAVFKSALALGLGMLVACPKPMEVNEDGASGGDGEDSDSGPSAKVFAVPQESLADDKSAIKVSGEITIDGYEKGIIQIDVTRKSAGDKKVEPVTIARFKRPGPFTLFLPQGSDDVFLYAFLDVGSDGPTVDDPRGEYAENPLDASSGAVDDVTIVIDMNNVPEPPPADRSPQSGAVEGAGAAAPGAEPGTGEWDLAAKSGAATTEPVPADDANPDRANSDPSQTAPADGQADGPPPPPSVGVEQEAPASKEPAPAAPAPNPQPSSDDEGALPDILSEKHD